jgi:hypothetical protein
MAAFLWAIGQEVEPHCDVNSFQLKGMLEIQRAVVRSD